MDTNCAFFFARSKLSRRRSAVATASCSDLTIRSSAALCAAPRSFRSCSSRAAISWLVHRRQEAIERSPRKEQPEKEPQQTIEAWRPDLLRGAALVRRRAANADGDRAHLHAAPVEPLESPARIRRKARQHGHQRLRGLGRGSCGRVSACRMDLRVDGRAEAWNGEQPCEVGQLAGRHQRQQDRGHRGQGRAGHPAQEKEQVPPEEERFPQVVRQAGARLRVRRPAVADLSWHGRQSPLRVDSFSPSIVSRIWYTSSTNPFSRCISFAGRSGGGTLIS